MSDSFEKKHIISFRNALILAAVIVVVTVANSILLRDNPEILHITSDSWTAFINFLATLGLIYGALNSDYDKNIRRAWSVLAFAQGLYTIGDIIWYVLEVGLHESPFPSLADGPYLAYFPIFALGIFLLPKVPLTYSEKLKVLLDTGIVMIASVILFWVLLIAPTIESNVQADALTSTLSVAYPVADLVLLLALIELLLRRIRSVSLLPILLLAASVAFMIATDFVFMSQSLQGTYVSGGLLDTGWIIAYTLTGLAGMSQANSKQLDLSSEILEPKDVQFTWPLYIPYICAGATYILLIWSHDHPMPVSFYALSWGLGGIIGMVIIRQVVALNENVRLCESTVKENVERKLAEKEIRRLNEELENRVTERTAQLESTNKELKIEIQERKKAEEALNSARDDLELRVKERTAELQSKNAEMERFVYTVSHDLRSPLVTIQGFNGFLKEDIGNGDNEKVKDDLRLIEQAVTKMDLLLSETLELSRIGRVANPPEDVPFEEIVQEALLQTSQMIKSAGIDVLVANNLPVVRVDKMRIVEAMVNLIENSLKYRGEQQHPRIDIGYRTEDRETVFFVRDNGMGIDPSQHEKVFELFYKVNNRSEGTGAGLAIVKRIIDVQGGRIWIESELGKGTTVCFTLPVRSSI